MCDGIKIPAQKYLRRFFLIDFDGNGWLAFRFVQWVNKQPVGEIRDAEADTDDGAYFVSCHKADRSPVD